MRGSVSSAFACPHQDCAHPREALSAQASAALGLGPPLASMFRPASIKQPSRTHQLALWLRIVLQGRL